MCRIGEWVRTQGEHGWITGSYFPLSGCSYMPGASSSLGRFNLHPDVPRCLLSISLDQTELNSEPIPCPEHMLLYFLSLLVSGASFPMTQDPKPISRTTAQNGTDQSLWLKLEYSIFLKTGKSYVEMGWEGFQLSVVVDEGFCWLRKGTLSFKTSPPPPPQISVFPHNQQSFIR